MANAIFATPCPWTIPHIVKLRVIASKQGWNGRHIAIWKVRRRWSGVAKNSEAALNHHQHEALPAFALTCEITFIPSSTSRHALVKLIFFPPRIPLFSRFNYLNLGSEPPTACGHRIANRKLKETKQLPIMLPGPAVPGSSLVSFYFLLAILCPQAVPHSKLT